MFRGVFNRSGRLYYRYRADSLSKCWAAIEASNPALPDELMAVRR